MSQRHPDSLQSRCAYPNSFHVISCSSSCSVIKCFQEQGSIVDCVFIYLVCCPQSSWWSDGVSLCFSLSSLCLTSLDNRPHNLEPTAMYRGVWTSHEWEHWRKIWGSGLQGGKELGFLGLIVMLRIELGAPYAEQAVSELQPSSAFLFYLEIV